MSLPHALRGRRAAWPALLAAALLLTACGRSGQAGLERPNIVLITIDTLRADHLGCYGYFRDTTPNIDALAKESVVFDQAYAAMATTLPSHASMLTARYPLEHGILANIMHGGKPFGWKGGMLSFAQVAKDAGYTTAAFVSAAPLKAPSGIGAGFDKWSEPAVDKVERNAGETIGEVLPWLEQESKQPFLLWVHLYDPHWKHRAPEPFNTLFDSAGPDPKLEAWIAERGIGTAAVRTNAKKVTETRKAINDYCGEVAYADSQVGVLLERLRAKGLLDKSVLVLCADHGEGLNQHDWTAHGLVWDEQLKVPLMMRFPPAAGIAPQRVGKLVSLIDLFPTVLGRLAPLGTGKEREYLELATGVDVLAPQYQERPVFGQRTGREIAESEDPGEMYAVTTKEWKFIHEPEVGDKLFDRRKDPFELDNVLEREKETGAKVRNLTEAMRQAQSARGGALGEATPGAVDPALQKQLQDLGYAGGEDGRSGDAPQRVKKRDELAAQAQYVQALVERLAASGWEERRDAAHQLGALGARAEAALAALDEAAQDPREEVRGAAAEASKAIRDALK